MKVTLQRNVHANVDILVDKHFRDSAQAESFFNKVAGNLIAKRFVLKGSRREDGRRFQQYVLNRKHYILSLH